mgnify:CR=1 FL=1
MITLESVSKQFGQQPVFSHVDLHLEQGEIIVIIGPSGTGKSTLLRCINFLERPEAGHITVGDLRVDARKASRADILALRRRTAFVFQNYGLFANKTALENISEGMIVVDKLPKVQAHARAREILARIGEPYMTSRAGSEQSSGGGLGLGLFIAKTLLERSGAGITFTNAFAERLGARVRAEWRREAVEAPLDLAQGNELPNPA